MLGAAVSMLQQAHVKASFQVGSRENASLNARKQTRP